VIAPGDDIDRIMAVMDAAFAPEFGEAWSRRQVEDALLVGNCHYGLVALHGGEPNGDEPAAGFFLSRHGVEEEELLLLGVVPEARRHGLGLALLSHFSATARARGATRLLLEMRRENPAAALYLGFGFVPVGERRNYYRAPGGERFDAVTFACECE
jgi:[ribosomal protein S18]-alanine N-acetyltransferase